MGESRAFWDSGMEFLLPGISYRLIEPLLLSLKICVVSAARYHLRGISSLTLPAVLLELLPTTASLFCFTGIRAPQKVAVFAPCSPLRKPPFFIINNAPAI